MYFGVHGFSPLPMGIEGKDRLERRGRAVYRLVRGAWLHEPVGFVG